MVNQNKMKKIEAKIVADSINQQGDRITTYLLTFPRFILSELNTHRVFSKNSASSRAIPFHKMVEMVETDPFIPIAWQKDHKGMQGTKYITDKIEIESCKHSWLYARDQAINSAKVLHGDLAIFGDTPDPYKPLEMGVTKQLCNRLLEPFMWHTVLLTGTEFENFFELRCPSYDLGDGTIYKSRKDALKYILHNNLDRFEGLIITETDWLLANKGQAEIHMMALAEAMYDAYNESTPKELKEGEWHIPFGDKIDEKELDKLMPEIRPASLNWYIEQLDILKIKIATARCARLSYMTFDGEIDYEKDLKLHDTLLESRHMSPFEHCARAMSNEEYQFFIKGKGIPDYSLGISSSNPVLTFRKNEKGWCNNYKGFIQYRYLIEKT